jgi:hypothetical protein
MAEQERQIAALRQQLQSLQTAAASRAAAGGRGQRQMDGAVPAEYICPITQVLCRPCYLNAPVPWRAHACNSCPASIVQAAC